MSNALVPLEEEMGNATVLTIVGNLTASPQLRYTKSGVPIAHFTVASTDRVQDESGGSWRDGDTLFLRCIVWRQLAENLSVSLRKGARVVVTGRLHQRDYRTEAGEQRSALELLVDEVGASLRYTPLPTHELTPDASQSPASPRA